MKLFLRPLLAIVLLLLILFIAGYILLIHIRTHSLPEYSEDIRIPGLTEEVVIVRDSFAIPHIYARNESDLYKAVGFSMAQDRLWQMDLLRRVTQGRISEVMGKDQLDTDMFMRALRIQEKSERVLANTSPEILAALESFSAGVNFYMNNHPLPPEFTILRYKPDPWQPVHSVNLIGYMSWDLSSGWNQEYLLHRLSGEVSADQLRQLLPGSEIHSTFVFPVVSVTTEISETLLSANAELEKLGAQIFYGSNNWAVAGNKSKTGKPLLANDTHLGFNSPGIWYQMHQVAEGSLNVTGLVLPGQPFVICGHNDSIAWGLTNVSIDDLDFYAETLNKDSTKYLLNGKWTELLVKEEIIATRKGQDVVYRQKFTHRGPIINHFKNDQETPLSIRWMGNELSNELRAVYLLNRAANWDEFRNAVSTFRSVSQNIVYADLNGNIGLQTAAGVPVREMAGIGIFPGDTSLYDWKGIVPFDELPFEYNPERGYVSSANNKTVQEDYPHYIGTWFSLPDRIDRIREMLEEKEKFDVEDFILMQGDYKSKKAERFTPRFIDALQLVEGEIHKAALAELEAWDYVLNKESNAASIFEILFRKVGENIIKDDLSSELFQAFMGERKLFENLMENVAEAKESAWIDNKSTPETENWEVIVNKAFYETVDELSLQFGEDVKDWEWGRLHTLTLRHPLGSVNILNKAFRFNRGPYSVPGSYHTVSPYSYSYNNLYNVNHGASQRYIYDLGNWNASKTVIPTGTSGIPASDYYLDQLDMYLENSYHSDSFTPDEVEKSARYRMKLLP